MPKPSDVRLYLDVDCRDVLGRMKDNTVHLVLTDPPYFLDQLKSGKWDDLNGKVKSPVVGKLPAGMKFDPKQGKELQLFMLDMGLKWMRVLRPGGFVLCFSQPRLSHRMAMGLETAGFQIRDVYTWHYTKSTQMKSFGMDHFINKRKVSDAEKDNMRKVIDGRKTAQLTPRSEHIIMAQKPCDGTLVDNYMKWQTGLIDASVELNDCLPHTVMHVEKEIVKIKTAKSVEYAHPSWVTPKPTVLLQHLISVFSAPGQTVLDPFLGSGSTAIAAARTGRDCVGIEISHCNSLLSTERLDDEHIEWRLCGGSFESDKARFD